MDALIVDDNEDGRIIMSTLFKEKGLNVSVAPNGKIALDMIKESTPDIIVTDILMPEMDGFELCRQIRTNPDYNHVIIIIYTGSYKSEADIELGHAIGANEYITKPQEPCVLTQLIEKAILEHKN